MKIDVEFKQSSTRFDAAFGEITVIAPEDSEEMQAQVEQVRKAILWRGGEISTTAGLDEMPEAIMNIPADSSLAFQTDEAIAYKKMVPSNAEEYALLSRLGGMTYKSKNLVDIPNMGDVTIIPTTLSVNFTRNIYISANIDVAPSSNAWIINLTYKNGSQQYFYPSHLTNVGGNKYTVTADNPIVSLTYRKHTLTDGNYSNFMISYGDAKVPYEPYYEGLRDTKVTAVEVNGADGTKKASRQLPSTITSLDGWGKGVDGYSNTYDFESGTYTKNCITLEFNGTENWRVNTSRSCTYVYQLPMRSIKGLCSVYEIVAANELGVKQGAFLQNSNQVNITDFDCNTLEDFKAKLANFENPLVITYALVEPITEEVPVAFDNFIKVEGGGAIEMVNEHQFAVPSTLKYTVKIGG